MPGPEPLWFIPEFIPPELRPPLEFPLKRVPLPNLTKGDDPLEDPKELVIWAWRGIATTSIRKRTVMTSLALMVKSPFQRNFSDSPARPKMAYFLFYYRIIFPGYDNRKSGARNVELSHHFSCPEWGFASVSALSYSGNSSFGTGRRSLAA
jgi:hypothetical protein